MFLTLWSNISLSSIGFVTTSSSFSSSSSVYRIIFQYVCVIIFTCTYSISFRRTYWKIILFLYVYMALPKNSYTILLFRNHLSTSISESSRDKENQSAFILILMAIKARIRSSVQGTLLFHILISSFKK